MSARGVTRKRRRSFDAGDFILRRRRTSLLVVLRSLRLLHWVVHCVGYGLHHPDTTGERHPASPNLQSGSPQGHHSDPAIWRHFDAHWRQFFPTLPTRSVFAKHGANLSMLKRMVQRVLYPAAAGIHLTDSFPISVCTSCRVSRRKIFKSEDEVSWGFCASKQQPYFGFHGHVVTNLRDEIVAFALTLANVDERLVVRNWFGQITGLLIGAKVSSSRTWTRSATTSPLITGYIVKRRMRSLFPRGENDGDGTSLFFTMPRTVGTHLPH
jgi:hypothetical protein